ncbi:hypothetical protein Tco_1553388, partial [Tanacetum coccineum]
VYRPKNKQERRSGNKKAFQQSSILKSLATWGKDDGITTLVKSILDGSALGSFGQGGVKVLSSSGEAPYYDDTIKALEAAFAVAVAEKIYAHESLTFSDTVACEVIFKWKTRLKEVMDVRSNVYVFNNSCRKSSDDSEGYYWKYTSGIRVVIL